MLFILLLNVNLLRISAVALTSHYCCLFLLLVSTDWAIYAFMVFLLQYGESVDLFGRMQYLPTVKQPHVEAATLKIIIVL